MSGALSESDAGVLAQLRQHGDVAHIPRPVYIWIYGEERDLRIVAPRLQDDGWFDTDPESDDGIWVIRAQREQTVTEADIAAMSGAIHMAIEDTEAEYDGWETSVERSS